MVPLQMAGIFVQLPFMPASSLRACVKAYFAMFLPVMTLNAAADEASRLGDAGYETVVTALLMVGFDCGTLGRFEQAESVLTRVIDEASDRGDSMHLAGALNNRAIASAAGGDATNTINDLKRVREIMREMGLAPVEFHVTVNLGEVYYSIGRLDEAEESAREAAEAGQRHFGENWTLSHAELLLARIALHRGDDVAVHTLVPQVRLRLADAQSTGRKDAELLPTDRALLRMLELSLANAGRNVPKPA